MRHRIRSWSMDGSRLVFLKDCEHHDQISSFGVKCLIQSSDAHLPDEAFFPPLPVICEARKSALAPPELPHLKSLTGGAATHMSICVPRFQAFPSARLLVLGASRHSVGIPPSRTYCRIERQTSRNNKSRELRNKNTNTIFNTFSPQGSRRFASMAIAEDYEKVLAGKYPAKEHARKVAKWIIDKGGDAKGTIYLEAQKQKLQEDNDSEAPFRYI